jgi:hypothetical protein
MGTRALFNIKAPAKDFRLLLPRKRDLYENTGILIKLLFAEVSSLWGPLRQSN